MIDANGGDWHGRIWRLAGPIILSNVSVPLLGIVDTAVMGHLPGPQYIGAVAVGAVIFHVVYWGMGFLRMGTTGFTAQALGANDADEVRATLTRALIVAVLLGVALIAVQRPIAWAALPLIKASPQVEPLTDLYFSIRIWGAPAALANFVFVGWFVGIHNTRAALVLQIVMNGVNIVLDLWFVPGLGWGVEGVAIATLIAEIGAVALGAALVMRNLLPIGGRWRRALILDAGRIRKMMSLNRDIFIRSLCLMGSFAVFTSVGARIGDVALAANAVLFNFQIFMAYALDAFAFAAEALVGSAIGAGDRTRYRTAVRVTSVWALVFAAGFAVFYAMAGASVIDAITDIEPVRAAARDYLPWAIVLPLISVWSFQLDGIFIGATRGSDMRNAMMLSTFAYIATLAVLVPWLGNHGLWIAFTVFMVARAITLGALFPAIGRSIESA
jgi:MATE family multidrug resistance protein